MSELKFLLQHLSEIIAEQPLGDETDPDNDESEPRVLDSEIVKRFNSI